MGRSLKPYGPGTAAFSPCKTWRYGLSRDLSAYRGSPVLGEGDKKPRGALLSIGLNPSTATCDDDDPTIHKESLYAILWGYATYWKANAYGYRATKPPHMFAARERGIDIVGPANDATIVSYVERIRRDGGRVLVAWGGNIELERQRAVAKLLTDVEVVCIKVNQDKFKTPFHPLYARRDAIPIPWSCSDGA